jgi:DNA-binding MarR family transcriptional regulator
MVRESGRSGGRALAECKGSTPEVHKGDFYSDYLPYLLARAAHQVAGQFHASLRSLGLTVLAWRVLAALADRQDWTVGSLCEVSLAKQPTVSKLLDRLQTRRLIVRSTDPLDARRTRVRITKAGLALIEPAIEQAKHYNMSLLAGHDQSGLAHLKASLRALIAQTNESTERGS